MTPDELRSICTKLIEAIGEDCEYQDFIKVLKNISTVFGDLLLNHLANESIAFMEMVWKEIETHVNFYEIQKEDLFLVAIAELENFWEERK